MSSVTTSPEVDELKELLTLAKLPAVRKVLEDAIDQFPVASSTAATPTAAASSSTVGMAPPVAAAVTVSQPSTDTKYEHFKWGWDSGEKFVSVYATVPNLKKTDKDKVKCDFTTSSFDLIVTGVDGKNYRLNKTNLDKDIKPDGSKVRVKDGRVVLLLAKANTWDFWSDLVSKTKRTAGSGGGGSGAPADGGVMDMMKQMYDSGDDNMKRVIGQAWEKSQKERLMGGGGGMGGGAAGMPGLGGLGGLGDEDLAF